MTDNNAAASEKRNVFHFRHRLASGRIADVDVHSNPGRWEGREALFSIIFDMSEHSRLQRRLKQALSSAKAGTWEWDLLTNENIWSDEIWDLYGLSRNETVPSFQSWMNTIVPEDRDRVVDSVKYAAETGADINIEWRVDGLGDEVRWLMSRGTAEFDDSGKAISYLGVVIDISSRKQAEDEKMKLMLQVQQSQKLESIGSLAVGVAHDINTVLGAILTTSSTSLKKGLDNTDAHDAFEKISRAAERGGKMVRSLLSFARHRPAEEIQVNLNDTLRAGGLMLEHVLLSHIQLQLDLEPNLKFIMGDPSALATAVMNLCVNASDAMPDSGILTIRTSNRESDWVELQVQDTGTGMPEAVLRRAMDPFFTTKPSGKGTGLGLSLVFATVKAHKGEMDIQSEVGRGTVVTMRFPACAEESKVQERLGDSEPTRPTPSLTILLVDDDEMIRDAVLESLELLGHRVLAAPNGESALTQLEMGLLPDLVILDMSMPGLGGRGTLPKLRALNPDVPVLLSTGLADQTTLDLVAAHPGVSLIQKPFSIEDLKVKLAISFSGTESRHTGT